jgi:hypothetical protein
LHLAYLVNWMTKHKEQTEKIYYNQGEQFH